MNGRFQRVILNGQTSDWETGFNFMIIFFLIYINDPTNNLKSNVKLFAGDISLFSEICDPLKTANVLNHDLRTICKWTKQWKWFLTRIQLNKLRK